MLESLWICTAPMLTTGKPVFRKEIGRVLFHQVPFLDAIFDLLVFRLLRITIFYSTMRP